jgi:hypothetical protein
MRFVILSEAKDPRSPEREPSAAMTKILRLTPQDYTSRLPVSQHGGGFDPSRA